MPRRSRPVAVSPVIALAALTVGLAACAPEPFIDMRREAGQLYTVGSSSFEAPAICYNTAGTTREQVQALADAVCAETGRVAVYERTDLLHCTVLQPHRALFRCEDRPGTPPPDAVRTPVPGVLGVQVPGARPPAADDLGIPDAPAAPDRPPAIGN